MDEGGSRNEASLSEDAQWRGPRGGAPLMGTLEDMLSKALEMGICFHRGPAFGKHGGGSFVRDFERWEKISYLENLYEGFERYVKNAL